MVSNKNLERNVRTSGRQQEQRERFEMPPKIAMEELPSSIIFERLVLLSGFDTAVNDPCKFVTRAETSPENPFHLPYLRSPEVEAAPVHGRHFLLALGELVRELLADRLGRLQSGRSSC